MRLNFTFKIAVIISLFLSGLTVYSQSTSPFISQLEGLHEGKEAKISMTDGIVGKDYIIQYRLKNTTNWLDSPVKIKKDSDVSEGIVTGLESNKNYCFQIMQKDSVTRTEILSNEVCSITLKSTLLSVNEVKLEWNKINSPQLSIGRISVMEESGLNFNSFTLKSSDTTYIYNQLVCSTRFKFNFTGNASIIINGALKNIVIKSPQILVDPKSIGTLPAPQSIGIVSVSGDSLVRYNIFMIAAVQKYEFYKSTNGGEMIKIGESSDNVFDDKNVDTGKNYYCYAFKYINACGIKSELSEKACTVKLSSVTYGRLRWTPFTMLADSNIYKGEKATYNVQVVDKSGIVMSTIGNTTDTTMTIDVERFLLNWSSFKFRVLARIQGKLYFDSRAFDFPLDSYSNSAAPYTILGNESSNNCFSVFPNPAEDKILIRSSGTPVSYIELIDMKGRVIYKSEISGDTFNISAFEKGKYILRLYDANQKLLNTKNIVKW